MNNYTEEIVTGIISCPLCRADVPVIVRVHGNMRQLTGACRCESCAMVFRVPAGRIKAAMDAKRERERAAMAAIAAAPGTG